MTLNNITKRVAESQKINKKITQEGKTQILKKYTYKEQIEAKNKVETYI